MSSACRVMLLTALLVYFFTLVDGAEIAYCSPDNTGADAGYQAGIESRPPTFFIMLTLVNQRTINISQMDPVWSNVKIPMPSPSSKGRTAGARTTLHLI